jgi:hypothetical protein
VGRVAGATRQWWAGWAASATAIAAASIDPSQTSFVLAPANDHRRYIPTRPPAGGVHSTHALASVGRCATASWRTSTPAPGTASGKQRQCNCCQFPRWDRVRQQPSTMPIAVTAQIITGHARTGEPATDKLLRRRVQFGRLQKNDQAAVISGIARAGAQGCAFAFVSIDTSTTH